MEHFKAYQFIFAKTENEFQKAKILFLEYAKSLNFDLCFQNFESELNTLNIQYNLPYGRLILVLNENNFEIGCVGIRKLDKKISELKRMYVKKEFRNKGIGKKLLQSAIEESKKLGYEKIQLDTISTMTEAISLYEKFGFAEISSYRYNPFENAKYFELNLIENQEPKQKLL